MVDIDGATIRCVAYLLTYLLIQLIHSLFTAGMPGHLFAILDNLQYRHPYIHEIATDPSYVPCKTDFGPMPIPYPAGCTPGCKNTYVHGMTASGMLLLSHLRTYSLTHSLTKVGVVILVP